MKSAGEIRQKIKQLQYRHVKRALCEKFPSGEDWPKDEVDDMKSQFREFFNNSPVQVISRDYPDVAALMWALEEQPDCTLMVDSTLVGRMGGVLIWADDGEDASVARSLIDRIVEAAESKERSLPVIRKSWWQRLFG